MKTDIDWNEASNLVEADPYLVWADLTEYQHFRLPDAAKWWLVLVELNESEGIEELKALVKEAISIPEIYKRNDIKTKKFRFCTARVKKEFFTLALTDAGKKVVKRYRMCLPVEYPVQALESTTPPEAIEGEEGKTIVALVDGGLAVGHSAFLAKNGASRLLHFWRQDDCAGSRYLNDRKRSQQKLPSDAPWNPCVMGYGAELTGAELNKKIKKHSARGMLDESALYQDLGLWELDRIAHHGTHVFSLAVGPHKYPEQFVKDHQQVDWGSVDDKASTCDLMAVQLAWANVIDTSGNSSDAHVLDALMYLYARCPKKAQLIVNISWGAHAGPHDGSSILEQAFLDWCHLRNTGQLKIVLSAGNNYQARGHANATIAAKEILQLQWRIPSESFTPHFLELWFEENKWETVEVTLTAPGKDDSCQVTVNTVTPTATLSGMATAVLVNRSYRGNGTMALLVVNPTAGESSQGMAAPGLWKVQVRNKGGDSLNVDAFIERNDVAMGLFTGARQSYFEDKLYNDQMGVDAPFSPSAPVYSEQNMSDIRRTGSFSSFSTGSNRRNVLSVGASIGLPGEDSGQKLAAPYSPRLGDRDKRSRRASVKKAPDCMAPGDERVTLWGLRGAGSRSGAIIRLAGTSVSVAQVVRTLAIGGDPLPPLLPGSM